MSRNLGSWDRALQAEGAACSKGTEVSGKFKEPSSYAAGENGEEGRGQIWRDPLTLRSLHFILKAVRGH